jgi:hypothetical protein
MLLTKREYESIYKVINSLILTMGEDPTRSCLLFSVIGGYILKKHFRVHAEPAAGLAAYHLGGDNNIILFGELDVNECYTVNDYAFHCWIEAEGWLIDFMAPTFSDLQKKLGKSYSAPSNMLQKPLSQMTSSVDRLEKSGDFYLECSPAITTEKLYSLSDPIYSDFAKTCVDWYRKPPRKMKKKVVVLDENGADISVVLKGNAVVGVW